MVFLEGAREKKVISFRGSPLTCGCSRFFPRTGSPEIDRGAPEGEMDEFPKWQARRAGDRRDGGSGGDLRADVETAAEGRFFIATGKMRA